MAQIISNRDLMALQELVKIKKYLHAKTQKEQPPFEEVTNYEDASTSLVPTSVFITSLYNRAAMTTAGRTLQATLENAAFRIMDQTHKVATDEEIIAFKNTQTKQLHERAEADKKNLAKQVESAIASSGLPYTLPSAAKTK